MFPCNAIVTEIAAREQEKSPAVTIGWGTSPENAFLGAKFGKIGWYVPLSVYPAGMARIPKCRCHWLPSLHSRSITAAYQRFSFQDFSLSEGCVRFKKLEDLALDVVGRTIARVSVEEHVASYRAARALLSTARNAGEGAAGLSKKGCQEARGEEGETKEVVLATSGQPELFDA